MTQLNNVIFNDMKAEEFLESRKKDHYFSHDIIEEEGEYISIEDAQEYAELYHQEQVKNNVVLADVSNPIDDEIGEQLNEFSKITGTKEPKKNRF